MDKKKKQWILFFNPYCEKNYWFSYGSYLHVAWPCQKYWISIFYFNEIK